MAVKDRIVFAIACVLMSVGGFRTEWGVTADSPWWSHITFQLTHANAFHLLGNLLAIFLYCKSGKASPGMWGLSLATAAAISMAYPGTRPLMGISGTVMCVLGRFLPTIWRSREVRMSMLLMAAASFASAFFGQAMAVLFHIACLAAGIITTKTKETIYDTRNQERNRNGSR